MLEKKITRTILFTTVAVIALAKFDGNIIPKQLPNLILSGKVTDDSPLIQKEIKRLYPKEKTVLVDSVTVTEKIYSLSVSDFIKYGTAVTPTV
jgi:hypothetical protein